MIHATIRRSSDKHTISRYLNGQFIEHLGSCIYDGIWVGKESHIPNIDGLRLSTIEALKKMAVPVIRWPGGLFADSYHWRDGIGHPGTRPIRQNLGWNSVESNQFGTHEFMHLCELVGAEPYICLNLGSGTVEEARSWVEYCNSSLDTTITRERAVNGHSSPFNVKFWGLGNEPGYPMDGMMRTAYYADIARQYAGYVKHHASGAAYKGDPRFQNSGVKIILADNRSAVDFCADGRNEYLDLIAVHLYKGMEIESDVSCEERYMRLMSALPAWQKEIKSACDLANRLSTANHSVDVAVDEWGIWHKSATPMNGLRQTTSLGDALFAASFLHLIYREKKVAMANIAQTVNVLHALILTENEQFCLTPTYHVFDMMKQHLDGELMNIDFSGHGNSKGRQSRSDISMIATRQAQRKIHITLVNPDLNISQRVRLEIPEVHDVRVTAHLLTSGEISDANSFRNPEMICPVPHEVKIENRTIEFSQPSKSVVLIELAENQLSI